MYSISCHKAWPPTFTYTPAAFLECHSFVTNQGRSAHCSEVRQTFRAKGIGFSLSPLFEVRQTFVSAHQNNITVQHLYSIGGLG